VSLSMVEHGVVDRLSIWGVSIVLLASSTVSIVEAFSHSDTDYLQIFIGVVAATLAIGLLSGKRVFLIVYMWCSLLFLVLGVALVAVVFYFGDGARYIESLKLLAVCAFWAWSHWVVRRRYILAKRTHVDVNG